MANMLYNGVELPDINTVWTDKATYPYALIVYNGAEYEVYISQGMFYYAAAGKWKSSAPNKYYLRNNNEWVFQYDKSGLSLSYLYWTPTWTNADIYTEGNSPTLKFAASDPVPVGGSHITTSSGDGFALYGGVKLPNIDTVWTGEVKETHPYACLVDNANSDEFVLLLSVSAFMRDGSLVGNSGSVVAHYLYKDALEEGWIDSEEVPGVAYPSELFFWTSADIKDYTDNSVHLAASDPIPLDGMTVIEWDGDKTGLDAGTYMPEGADSGYSLYKVAEYVPLRSGDVFAVHFVASNGAEIIGADDYYEAEFGSGGRCHSYLIASAPAGTYTPTVGTLTATITLPSDGLYMYSSDDGQARTTLYAYSTSGEGGDSYNETEFLSGLVMGLCSKGNPTFTGSGKMLYNGVTLPNINSVLSQYPQYTYALVLNYKATSVYRLNISNNPYGIGNNFSGEDTYKSNGAGVAFWLENGVWTYHNTFTGTTWTVDDYSNAWTSHDILSDDGNIYLAASAPISAEADPFVKGYLVGAELRRKRVLPVAYLYNGVRLPKLPEWDKEKYPYVHIYPGISLFGNPDEYSLYPSDKPLQYGEVNGEMHIYYPAGATTLNYRCELTDGEFKTWEEEEGAFITTDAPQKTIWTNHNVISDTDGSVYYAASEPVPVY